MLGAAACASFLLVLWLTRGITFHTDDFLFFVANRGFNLKVLIAPHNGHLMLIPRLIYAIGLKTAGARH